MKEVGNFEGNLKAVEYSYVRCHCISRWGEITGWDNGLRSLGKLLHRCYTAQACVLEMILCLGGTKHSSCTYPGKWTESITHVT